MTPLSIAALDPMQISLMFVLAAGLRWSVDMILPPTSSLARRSFWSLGALALSAVLTPFVPFDLGAAGGVATPLAGVAVLLVIGATVAALLLATVEGSLGDEAERPDAEVLMLLASAGMTALVGAADLWTAFIAFELMSLPFYALAAFRRGIAGVEAGFRLLLPGAVATLLFVLGAGTAPSTIGLLPGDAVAWLGFTAILAAVLFKAALLPFGFWVGDVYRGVPIGVLGFLASAPKFAALVFIARLVEPAIGRAGVTDALAAAAEVSMLVGTAVALHRRTLRGILAWSGVAHMGFALLILLGPRRYWDGTILLYGASYILAVIASMAAVAGFERRIGASDLDALTGFGRSGLWLPIAFIVALFSLAGIPFLPGFWGKFFAMLSATRAENWLALAVALGATVVGLYVYLRIVGKLVLSDLKADGSTGAESSAWQRATFVGVVAAVLSLLVGIAPAQLLAYFGYELLK